MFANTNRSGSGSFPDVCLTPGPGPVPSPFPNMGTVHSSDVVTHQVVIAPILPCQDPAGGAPLPMPKVQVTIINP
jgi:hypothetical protein